MTQISKEYLDNLMSDALADDDEVIIELIEEIFRLRKEYGKFSSEFNRQKRMWVKRQQQLESYIRRSKNKSETRGINDI